MLSVRSSSPRLPSTPFDHRHCHQVRTSHSSSCPLPPLCRPPVLRLYILLRYVARLIGVINAFLPCSVTSVQQPQLSTCRPPGGRNPMSLIELEALLPNAPRCPCDVGVSRPRTLALRTTRAPEKHVRLRSVSRADSLHAFPTPSRRMSSPASRPSPASGSPALCRAVHTPRRRPCRRRGTCRSPLRVQ